MRNNSFRAALAAVLVLTGLLIVHGDSPATLPAGKKVDLGGAERYRAHIATDKPIYRAGETVYVRAAVLRADTHAPLPGGHATALVEIKGPKGDTVATGQPHGQDSVVAFQWPVPEGQAGGQYTIKLTFPFEGHAPAERTFEIRAYRAPRLKSQIVFLRDGYGPGDQVSASLHTERAEGGIPAGAKVTATALVDGQEAWTGAASIDPAGNCTVNFKLPAKIERGEGTLSLAIQDGGVVETAAKTIPILLQTVDLRFYPEGGDLVRGIEQRVYFQAKQPNGKPADIAGEVVDADGNVLTTFKTQHEGRGRLTLANLAGKSPIARITAPAGIKTTYTLPAIKERGVSLIPASEVFAPGQPLKFALHELATTGGKLTISQREKVVGEVAFGPQNNPHRQLEVKLDDKVDGVLIATVWDDKGQPLAERLVYRQPARELKVTVTADQSSYAPAERVTLRVVTTDPEGNPVPAVVGLTVTDDSVLEMIEKREQAPRLPVMVLLEGDVQELADAHVYLDRNNPQAGLATDLLLGTQGWRRLAMVDVARFLEQHGDAARRVVALKHVNPEAAMRMRARAMVFDGVAAMAEGAPAPAMARLNKPMAPPQKQQAGQAPAPPKPAVIAGKLRPLDMDRKAWAADEIIAREEPAQVMAYVREYAHAVRPGRLETDRVDFAETLYWNAGIKTDERTGAASVSFALSDAVTTFRVFADAFDKTGQLGSASGAVESVQPFYVEPKMPLEVTAGDVVQLPVAMVNGTGRDLPMARLMVQAPAGIVATPFDGGFTLKAKERIRRTIALQIGQFAGTPQLVLDAQAGPYADKVSRPLSVQPFGFPVENAKGGLLDPNKTVTYEITIPKDVAPGSVKTAISVFPTPLGNLTSALERLIQEPYGCFEQTSATSYPLVMAQQYFLSHTGVDPRLVQASKDKLEKAYAKLTGFECKQKGYEWFGGDPGHEALTAYGLLQFTDMSQVRKVDAAMIQRTRQWLLDRRDGKGSFQRNARALDSFGGAPQVTTDAYIIWALLESGEKGLEKEIAQVKQSALASSDSYVMAVGANVLAIIGDKDASRLMDALSKRQKADGVVEGALTSITRSGGQALAIETTALAVLAWLRDPNYAAQVEKGAKWIVESCKNGRFGSTQSTILALRAIIAYDKSRARPKAAGTIRLLVDGKAVGQPAEFNPQSEGAISMPDVAALLTPGKHTIELKMDNGSSMPFAIGVNYYDVLPASSDQCKLGIEVALAQATVTEGNATEARVIVINRSKDVLPTPVAIVGIPGGLEVRHDQLKELVKAQKIDAYEVIGRQVVLYWRHLQPEARVQLPLSLIAAIPGTYTGPASRAYLYYTDELKSWVPGVRVTIESK